MKFAPIHRGAIRPQGRPRHALALALVRLMAITGFALAGWIALTALTESASASASQTPTHQENQRTAPAPHNPPPDQVHPTAQRPGDIWPADARPVDPRPAGVRSDDARPAGVLPVDVRSRGGRLADARSAAVAPVDAGAAFDGMSWEPELDGAPGRVREIGDHPVRFLQARRHEVFHGKDRAVHHVRKLADAAGVPRVRIPDVRPDAPIVGGLVHDIADEHPVLGGGLLPEAQEQPAADGETHASDEAEPDEIASARTVRPSIAPGAFAGDTGDQGPGHCAICQGERRAPGPVLPSGQDHPRGGGSGGHSFAPVADLRSGRYPAAPPAVETSTFRRTALTDVSAPGGPSVVPD